jgi:hypothetical protein
MSKIIIRIVVVSKTAILFVTIAVKVFIVTL